MTKDNKWERTRLTLIARLKNREDQESWDSFVDLYWKRLYSLAIKKGLTDAEAKDAVQETMIGLVEDIDKYDPSKGRFTAWLLGRARWRIQDQFRTRKHQGKRSRTGTSTRTDTVQQIVDEAAQDRSERLLEKEWMEYLHKLAIDKIKKDVKPGHFQVYDLLVVKGLSVAEVSALTGVTPATIYTIKHRILSLVEEEIEILKKQSP